MSALAATLATAQPNQAYLYSVVFASAYRTSVLFTYDVGDPSYTLAPTVGWTEIEIAAGIVSACLPTMLPVLKWFMRTVGITSLSSTLRGTSQGDSKLKGSSAGFNHELSSRDPTLRSKEARGNTKRDTFYRLPDDTDSDVGRGEGSNDLNLRPDGQKFEVTINTSPSRGDRDDCSGDEVALNTIHVQKELRQTSHIV